MQQIATNFKNRLTKRKVKAAEKRQVCHVKLPNMVVLPNMGILPNMDMLPNMAGAPREALQGRRGHRSRTQEDRQEEVCTGGARPEEEGEGRCAEQRRQRRRRRRLSVWGARHGPTPAPVRHGTSSSTRRSTSVIELDRAMRMPMAPPLLPSLFDKRPSMMHDRAGKTRKRCKLRGEISPHATRITGQATLHGG
jgi:hypothetical protein